MKIIFLDIDGVLNVIPQGFDKFGGIFHQHFIDNLKRIVDETCAKIVISSTWRFNGLQSMQLMWEFRDLPGKVIGITPSDNYITKHTGIQDVCRGDEIQWYIDKYSIKSYVILDDDNDMLPSQMKNFVQTSDNSDHYDCIDIGYGLTDICTQKAIEILNNYE